MSTIENPASMTIEGSREQLAIYNRQEVETMQKKRDARFLLREDVNFHGVNPNDLTKELREENRRDH